MLAAQLLTALAGVSLLVRMGPAIDLILQENVYSTAAVEDMLGAVVEGNDAAFAEALERATGNVTELGEVPLLETLEALADPVMAGDEVAREQAMVALVALGDVNRDSMQVANIQAHFMGVAGAWAMAMLGFVSFLVTLVVYSRIGSRMISPVQEVDAVLAAVRSGDTHRRCQAAGLSYDIGRVSTNLNWLLDQRQRASTRVLSQTGVDRDAVLALVDHLPHPVLLGDAQGQVLVANVAALDLAPSERAAVAAGVVGQEAVAGWQVHRRVTGGWMAEKTASEGLG
ncbi:MAG: hypothetical protein ACJAZO_000717 [Myxococcota bacterium]|jgi:hypothetical protein